MRSRWLLLLPTLLLLPALLLLPVSTAAGRDAPAPLLEKRLGLLCERLEAQRQKLHIPGMALVVVKDDKVLLAKGFGLKDIQTKEPVTTKTLFAIGSSSKAFTAALLGMLQDDGTLTLDDPVKKHLPYFQLKDKTANAEVTLRDLLCHRTGLTRMGILWAANRVGREDILKQVKEAELYKPFRKHFLYNNVMYLAAGQAGGAAAKSTYDTLIAERIFKPLGMSQANLSMTATIQDPSASKGYRWDEAEGRYDLLPMRDLGSIAPAGAINANVEDMAPWLRFLLAGGEFEGKRLLSKERLEECWKPHQQIGGEVSYGLGWMLRNWEGKKVVEHGGNIDGFAAQVGLLPEERLGYALLMNVTASPLQQASLKIVWESMLGDLAAKSDDAPKSEPLTEAEMQPYVGEYQLSNLNVRTSVRVEKGRLGIDIPGQMFFVLKWPDEKDQWAFEYPAPIKLEFAKPVDGSISSFELRQAAGAQLKRTSEQGPLGEAPPEAGKAWTEAQMQPLIGTYHLTAANQDWEIKLLKDELHVLLPGQQPHPMHWPDAEGRWKIKVDPNQSLRFARGADGAVTAFDFQRLVVSKGTRISDAPAGDVTVDQLFEKRAASGALKLSSPRWHLKGKITFANQGVSGTIETWLDGPTRLATVIDLGKFGVTKKVLDGEKAWTDSDFAPFEEATGQMLEYMKFEHPIGLFGDWRKLFKRMTVGKKSEIGSEAVYAVRCTPHKAPALTRYVSAKTGLVLKDDWYVIVKGMTTFPIKVTFSDYRMVGGMPLPFRQESASDQTGRVVIQVESAEAVETIPPAAFERR